MQLTGEIRESEAQYRLLAENMVDVIWVLDLTTGRFTYVSPSVKELRGYSPEEVLAQPMTDAMTPDLLQMINESLPTRIGEFLAGDPAAVSQTHEIGNLEDGSTIWTEVVTTILQDEAEPFAYSVLVLIYLSVEMLKLNYASARNGYACRWTRAASVKWRYNIAEGIIRFDERGREHYGFDRDSVTVEEVLTRIHPDDVERFKNEMASTLDPIAQNKQAMEYRVIHPDGVVRWVSALATIYFEGQGELRHAMHGFGTSQDITDRKNAERKAAPNRRSLL